MLVTDEDRDTVQDNFTKIAILATAGASACELNVVHKKDLSECMQSILDTVAATQEMLR